MTTFEATEATKQNKDFKAAVDSMTAAVMDQFFDLWETENDPRNAGSIIAHHLIGQAARIAIFGAMCANHEPLVENWIAACTARFDDEMKVVKESFDDVFPDGNIDDTIAT